MNLGSWTGGRDRLLVSLLTSQTTLIGEPLVLVSHLISKIKLPKNDT